VSRVFGRLVGGDTNVKACCCDPEDVKEDPKSVQLGRALSLTRKAESSQLTWGAVYGDLKVMLVTPPGGAAAADMAAAEWTYHHMGACHAPLQPPRSGGVMRTAKCPCLELNKSLPLKEVPLT
jgi:hypothetical protein